MIEPDADHETEWLVAAAGGDLPALRSLVHFCMAQVTAGDVSVFEAASMAEPFARLAEARGGSFEKLLLADVLNVRASELAALGYAVRATAARGTAFTLYDQVTAAGDETAALAARLTALADEGDEEAATRLDRLMSSLTPKKAQAVAAQAKRKLRESATYWDDLEQTTANYRGQR